MSFFETYLGSSPRVLIVAVDDTDVEGLVSALVPSLDGALDEQVDVDVLEPRELTAALNETAFALVLAHDPPVIDALDIVERTPGLPPDAPIVLAASDPDDLAVTEVFDAGIDDVVELIAAATVGERVSALVADVATERESTTWRS